MEIELFNNDYNSNIMKTPTNLYKCRIYDISYLHKDNKITCIITYHNPILNIKQTTKGVAKCNTKDKYNMKKGERIAESRAKIAIYNAHFNSVKDLYNRMAQKHYKLKGREVIHVNRLIHDEILSTGVL